MCLGSSERVEGAAEHRLVSFEESLKLVARYAESQSWWMVMCHHEDTAKIEAIEAFIDQQGLRGALSVDIWAAEGAGIWYAFHNEAVSADDMALLTGIAKANLASSVNGYFMLITEGGPGELTARALKAQFPDIIEHTVPGGGRPN